MATDMTDSHGGNIEATDTPYGRVGTVVDLPLNCFDNSGPNYRSLQRGSRAYAQLKSDIAQAGVRVPIEAYWDPDRYKLSRIDGQARLEIAQELKLPSLKVMLVERPASDAERISRQFTINAHRLLHSVSAVYGAICAMRAHGMTQREVADELRLSDSTISRYEALLRLTDEAREAAFEERIALRDVPLVAALTPDQQRAIAAETKTGRLFSTDVGRRVRKLGDSNVRRGVKSGATEAAHVTRKALTTEAEALLKRVDALPKPLLDILAHEQSTAVITELALLANRIGDYLAANKVPWFYVGENPDDALGQLLRTKARATRIADTHQVDPFIAPLITVLTIVFEKAGQSVASRNDYANKVLLWRIEQVIEYFRGHDPNGRAPESAQ